MAAMTSDKHGLLMNLATGSDSSLTEVVHAVLKACGSTLEPEYRPDTRAVRSAGGTHLGFSRKRAGTEIGWVPRVSLEEGVRRYIRWLQRQPSS
jgi:UDP-glucose 4-epimerase